MTAWDLLSEPVRRYIRDQKWEALRPIQTAAITKVLGTDNHYILVSRTASGKTEAAFLPVLSAVDFSGPGVQVLYISPLIALINDQFQRAEMLCKYLDVPVTRWHGEAGKSLKNKILQNPEGILLITPESVEALFANRPEYALLLFSHLKFIIIDEIHSFLGTDRGLHLKSLVWRIRQLNSTKPARIIGLSATLGDYDEAKLFTGEPERTKILRDTTPAAIASKFVYWPVSGHKGYPDAFIDELYTATKNHKTLLFPNSKAKVEELAQKLAQKARERNSDVIYFAHHASVNKDMRENIETFARNNKHQPFCIVCTSTLELGIDIGSIDLVIQVDATHSVTSLIQRTGRSGRQENAQSNLLLFATNPWSLLQSIACRELYETGFVEPLHSRKKPFDILFHQILSVLKESNGMGKNLLVKKLKKNITFNNIEEEEIITLISHMIESDYIEDLKRELIVGYEGEQLTNDRNFYAMFSSPKMLTVVNGGKSIGTIPYETNLHTGFEILLAGKNWKISHIDYEVKKITVVPGSGKGKAIFSGEGADIHQKVGEKMLELLCSRSKMNGLDADATNCLTELRLLFRHIEIKDYQFERPVLVDGKRLTLYVFAGSRIYHTLAFLLRDAALVTDRYEITLSAEMDFSQLVPFLCQELELLPSVISEMMDIETDRFHLGKWGKHLPPELRKKYVLEQQFDIDGTAEFLKKLHLVNA